jgi:hypothetical protein
MTAPLAVLDTLQSILDAESTSIFRLMTSDHPHALRLSQSTREALSAIVLSTDRRLREVCDFIEAISEQPPAQKTPVDDAQLKHLSPKFFLPKLIEEKKLLIERLENAAGLLRVNPQAAALVRSHLHEHLVELEDLIQSAGPAHR